jgi:hypothetical protein
MNPATTSAVPYGVDPDRDGQCAGKVKVRTVWNSNYSVGAIEDTTPPNLPRSPLSVGQCSCPGACVAITGGIGKGRTSAFVESPVGNRLSSHEEPASI